MNILQLARNFYNYTKALTLAGLIALSAENLHCNRPQKAVFGEQKVVQSKECLSESEEPIHYKIVFQSNRGNHSNLWLINPDGTDLNEIPNFNKISRSNPACSPNGDVAFISTINSIKDGKLNTAFYLVKPDGTNEQILNKGGEGIDCLESWSRDGKKLIYISYQNPGNDIFVHDLNKNLVERLTNDPSIEEFPLFSSDGKNIFFSRLENCLFSVWVMDSDGKNQRRLSQQSYEACSISPDGKYLAVMSENQGKNDIFLMDTNGEIVKQLTNTGNNKYPKFSPAGKYIAYVQDNRKKISSQVFESEGDIWVMDSDGTNQRQLTEGQYNDLFPDWLISKKKN